MNKLFVPPSYETAQRTDGFLLEYGSRSDNSEVEILPPSAPGQVRALVTVYRDDDVVSAIRRRMWLRMVAAGIFDV
jgi:hypothetical protein